MPDAVLGVAAVARRLGVATGTLRTWDRRYGVGPDEHPAGSPRRYTPRDLARLEVMHRLMLEGVTAAEAARIALGTDLPTEATPVRSARSPRQRPGGGRVVAMPNASPAARGLARAATSLDSDACITQLLSAVRRDGVLPTWHDLLLPVLSGLGERWRATGRGVVAERLLSESAEVALYAGTQPTRGIGAPIRGRPVLLAALEGEDHRLPLVALSAALTERAVPSRMLGVRLPLRALRDAVTRTGPSAVFLWAQGVGSAALPGPEVFRAVRPRPVVVLGGPGYEAEQARPGVSWVTGLEEAVAALTGPRTPPGGTPPARRANPARTT